MRKNLICLFGISFLFGCSEMPENVIVNDEKTSLKSIAIQKYIKKDYDSAAFYFEGAANEFRKTNQMLELAKAYNNAGASYAKNELYLKSIEKYKVAIEEYRKIGNDTLLSESLKNLGTAYKQHNIYQEALVHLHESAQILKKLEKYKELAAAWTTIGNIHRLNNNYKLSYDYLIKGLNLRLDKLFLQDVGMSYQNLGLWYLANEKYPDALKQFRKAYGVFKTEDSGRAAAALSSIGNLYLATGDLNKAIDNLQKSLQLRIETKSKEGIITTSSSLIRAQLLAGDHSTALSYTQLAEENINPDIPSGTLRNYLSAKVDYLKTMEQYKEALVCYDSLYNIREIVADDEKRKELIASEIKYQTSYYKEELILKEEALKAEKTINSLYVAVSILLSGMLMLGGMSLKRERRLKNINIGLKKREEDVNKALRHATKDHIIGQKTLLSLHSKMADKHGLKDQFDSAKNRLQVLAEIHQMFLDPKASKLASLRLDTYVKKLIDNLMIVFNLNQNKLSLIINVDEVFVSISTAFYVGLIVNEAITNAFKYAVQGNPRPEINIRLTKEDKILTLSISDNGPGYSVEGIRKDSMGLGILNKMTKQLKGVLTLEHEKGVNILIQFENKPLLL